MKKVELVSFVCALSWVIVSQAMNITSLPDELLYTIIRQVNASQQTSTDVNTHVKQAFTLRQTNHQLNAVLKHPLQKKTLSSSSVVLQDIHEFSLDARQLSEEQFYGLINTMFYKIRGLACPTWITDEELGILSILCPTIEELSLKSCFAIHDFSPIAEFLSLKILDLSYTPVEDATILGIIKSCTQLDILDITGCDYISDETRDNIKKSFIRCIIDRQRK